VDLLPDYGLYLLNHRISRDTEIIFYSIAIKTLTFVDESVFTTMLNKPADDTVYAMSLDFPTRLFGALMHFAPTELKAEAEDAIRRSHGFPFEIIFSEEFSIGLSARIGELQHGRDDDFVPLVVEEIF